MHPLLLLLVLRLQGGASKLFLVETNEQKMANLTKPKNGQDYSGFEWGMPRNKTEDCVGGGWREEELLLAGGSAPGECRWGEVVVRVPGSTTSAGEERCAPGRGFAACSPAPHTRTAGIRFAWLVGLALDWPGVPAGGVPQHGAGQPEVLQQRRVVHGQRGVPGGRGLPGGAVRLPPGQRPVQAQLRTLLLHLRLPHQVAAELIKVLDRSPSTN